MAAKAFHGAWCFEIFSWGYWGLFGRRRNIDREDEGCLFKNFVFIFIFLVLLILDWTYLTFFAFFFFLTSVLCTVY